MASLKNKTISGIFWSFLQKVGSKGIGLVATIVLARILSPESFGLIGMLTIFIQLSQAIVQGGFKQALIQKKDTDEEDYSSVFWVNLVVSVLIYGILYITAPFIAQFYDQSILTELTRILALVFVINAFSYVQEAKLTKEMKFKTLMIIHLPSTVISGIVAVTMALMDFGVWSIVGQQVSMRLAFTVQIWWYSKWKPLWSFHKQKAKVLFNYGSKMMLSAILNTSFKNVYFVLIGKFAPVATLGYYQNSRKFIDVPSKTLVSIVKNVAFPSLSSIQEDNIKIRRVNRKFCQQLLFWSCPVFIIAGVLANPLVSFILTDKWLPMVSFFQLLCIVGVLHPLVSFNHNIIAIKGRSGLFLKLEIIQKIVLSLGLCAFMLFSLDVLFLISVQVFIAFFNYLLYSFNSGKLINYPLFEQIKDILPVFLLSIGMGLVVLLIDTTVFVNLSNIYRLVFGCLIGAGVYLTLSWKIKLSPFQELMAIIRDRKNIKNNTNGK